MYTCGDLVVYGVHGVCRITELEQRTVDRKRLTYYVLEPLDQDGARYYVPTHNESAVAKMLAVLSAQALEALLRSNEVRADAWIPDENLRKQTYRELISSGDRTRLLQMVCSLHRHKSEVLAAGKKFHLCDDNFLRDAQKLLCSEFSLVLGIPANQVGEYVRKALSDE